MIRCPGCEAALVAGARRCAVCRRALATGPDGRLVVVLPTAVAGEVLACRRFPPDELPGMPGPGADFGDGVAFALGPRGALFTLRGGRAGAAIEPMFRLRDAVVSASFTAYDPGAVLGVLGRSEPLGDASTYYMADVDPSARLARVVRRFSTPLTAGETVLEATTSAAIAPVGAPNRVAFALSGPVLRLFVNGQLVLAAHDPVYGIGQAGLILARTAPPDGTASRLAVHDFTIAAVTS
jgi:hypothetical protein